MSLPDGPGRLSFVDIVRWIRDPFERLHSWQARYGDAFTLRVPTMRRPVVVLADPESIKDLFAQTAENAHAGETNEVLKPFLGRRSMLLLDGAEHVRRRKMVLPTLQGERMHAFGQTMLDLAHQTIDTWPVGKPFAVHGRMQDVTLQVIVRTVFGVEAGPRFRQLVEILTRNTEAGTSPLLLFPAMQRDLGRFSPWGRYVHYSNQARRILLDEIHRGRQHGTADRVDMLALMLQARDEAGQTLTDDEMLDDLMTMLVGGHGTSATALSWAIRWIFADPPLLRRLRGEVGSAGGDPGRIAKLEWLDMTIRESLRLHPVIPVIARVLKRPLRLGSLELPAETAVAPSIYLLHRRPSIYPEPGKFRPERFTKFKPSPWEWLPFGGGLRRCVGGHYAIYEMKMVLSAILSRVDAHLVEDAVRPVRSGITTAPAGGLPIVVTRRAGRFESVAVA